MQQLVSVVRNSEVVCFGGAANVLDVLPSAADWVSVPKSASCENAGEVTLIMSYLFTIIIIIFHVLYGMIHIT